MLKTNADSLDVPNNILAGALNKYPFGVQFWMQGGIEEGIE